MKGSHAYQKAGVDIEKADRFVSAIASLVRSTHGKRVRRISNGYAGLYQLDQNRFIAATTDGVGTKLKLAFALKKHDTIGVDLVAMSVNDLICVGAEPLFFLDYFATGRLDLKVSRAVLKGIASACSESNVALVGGETAEMPSMYAHNEYDLGGFAVGLVDRKNLIDGSGLKTGDVLLGVHSSGLHSNGFSLVRKLIHPNEKHFMSQCLTPTKLYVKAAKTLRGLKKDLKAMAHITGSGFLNVPRLNENFHYDIRLDDFEIPELFRVIQHRGSLSSEEMFTTFNMGIGLVIAISPRSLKKASSLLQAQGYQVSPIGFVGKQRRSNQKSLVTVRGPGYHFKLKY